MEACPVITNERKAFHKLQWIIDLNIWCLDIGSTAAIS